MLPYLVRSSDKIAYVSYLALHTTSILGQFAGCICSFACSEWRCLGNVALRRCERYRSIATKSLTGSHILASSSRLIRALDHNKLAAFGVQAIRTYKSRCGQHASGIDLSLPDTSTWDRLHWSHVFRLKESMRYWFDVLLPFDQSLY